MLSLETDLASAQILAHESIFLGLEQLSVTPSDPKSLSSKTEHQASAATSLPPWQLAGRDHLWMPYCQMKTAPQPVAVEHAQGVRLHLADGRTLIDGLASWWSACHGYSHPDIVAAMTEQLQRMSHVMFGGVHHEPAAVLAAGLAELLPGDLNRVFLIDSGSVAVELAMKMAIQYHLNRGQTGRTRFVSFANAYHGDTTGAMSLCDPNRSMHAHFAGGLLQQISVALPQDVDSLGSFEDLLQQRGQQIAAVFIEPLVQGAGGMRFHSADVLRGIAELCKRDGILLVADELATGFGRTGTMFAIEQADIVPDIICLGKALTAGMVGMAATVATEEVFAAFWCDDPAAALMHGPTFMANPLACAAANASLQLFRDGGVLRRVTEIERTLQQQLACCADLDPVVEVRVKGAIGAIQVDKLVHLDRLRQAFIDRGVWLRPFGDCIYTTPPLVIDDEDLLTLCRVICEVVAEWATWPRS
ncbi:Adenosylmethionine-8-amino-7-oxononanoate aminotransferase [Stieleria bergensis]|uniref:Adenosylmethionine-8-amino-7-oxononanoate aminotransferase n=1 Tax=Stieleria bergensis TaxID=2528025 RepID=A0A517SYB1_9BACT|nr:Adenosylmethionine-8-amino-7-oxononanoate aminotransferase [Planctomycetes bacterium SV_7m_r]